jgi:hypothetical protein
MSGHTVLLVNKNSFDLGREFARLWEWYLDWPEGSSASVEENLVLKPSPIPVPPLGFLAVLEPKRAQNTASRPPDVTNVVWTRDEDVLDCVAESKTSQFKLLDLGSGGQTRDVSPDRWKVSADGSAAEMIPGRLSWEDEYRRYRRLEQNWMQEGKAPPDPDVRGWLRQTLHGIVFRDPDAGSPESRDAPPGIPTELWEEAWSLQDRLRPLHTRGLGRDVDEPLDDVYHAALVMRWTWTSWTNSGRAAYRGQRDYRWRLYPKLYRDDPSPERLDSDVQRLTKLVGWLRTERPDLDELQCIATAQHYSSEANVSTWLVDFTYDPMVALFFASDHGKDNDVGVVHQIRIDEWKRLSSSGRARLGSLTTIDVPGVQRIEAQRGLFLVTSHPDLFEQYVAYTIRFSQHDGLTFEDISWTPPVSRSHMYPIQDSTKDAIDQWSRGALVSACGNNGRVDPQALMPPSPYEKLEPADYAELVCRWLEDLGVSLTDPYTRVAEALGRIYFALQQRPEVVGQSNRSLHQLARAAKAVVQFRTSGINQAFGIATELWIAGANPNTQEGVYLAEVVSKERARLERR